MVWSLGWMQRRFSIFHQKVRNLPILFVSLNYIEGDRGRQRGVCRMSVAVPLGKGSLSTWLENGDFFPPPRSLTRPSNPSRRHSIRRRRTQLRLSPGKRTSDDDDAHSLLLLHSFTIWLSILLLLLFSLSPALLAPVFLLTERGEGGGGHHTHTLSQEGGGHVGGKIRSEPIPLPSPLSCAVKRITTTPSFPLFSQRRSRVCTQPHKKEMLLMLFSKLPVWLHLWPMNRYTSGLASK